MKTSEEQYVFIRLHLGDCMTEFVNYKKLDRQLANEIELAIVDIVKDAQGNKEGGREYMKEINFKKLRDGYEEVQMVESSIENAYPEAYRLARKFHELYEQQAPFFGYITNSNSREFYPNSNNARLMAYVCFQIVQEEKEEAIKEVLLKYKEAFEKAGLNFDGTLSPPPQQ